MIPDEPPRPKKTGPETAKAATPDNDAGVLKQLLKKIVPSKKKPSK
jgi:hypothetical protein